MSAKDLSKPSQIDEQEKSTLPARIVRYEWEGTDWNINDLLERVSSDVGRDVVYHKLVFQRRLRAQLQKTGRIDPYEAAIKKQNSVQGGICYRIDHYNGQMDYTGLIKTYVGITQTDLETRLSRHITQARRPRGPNSRQDSLPAAIRAEIERGVKPSSVFRIALLERAYTNDELVALEMKWVGALNSMVPRGYNIHPPGSLGGPSNSRPVEFDDAGDHHITSNFAGAWLYFREAYGDELVPALGTCRWRYQQFLANQKNRTESTPETHDISGRVLTIQWVFGVDEDVPDGRQGDTPCTVNGKFYASVGAAAEANNERYEAAHSRYHRRLKEHRAAGRPEGEPVEIGDRRAPQFGAPALQLPDPDHPESGKVVSASAFAKRTDTFKSSVLNRWEALNADPERLARLSQAEIVRILKHGEGPQREIFEVHLPDGKIFSGARYALAKAFGVGGDHAGYCQLDLSLSAIKARLRALSSNCKNDVILLALGVIVPEKPHTAACANLKVEFLEPTGRLNRPKSASKWTALSGFEPQTPLLDHFNDNRVTSHDLTRA